MANVTVLDVLTETPVDLDSQQSAQVSAEIDAQEPNALERLFMQLFPGPNARPRIKPDYLITVSDGGHTRSYELLTETVLQRADSKQGFNFYMGPQIIAWHQKASGVSRL